MKYFLLFEKEIIKNPNIHRTILEFIHNKENEIGYKNLEVINSDSDCGIHLNLLQKATTLLFEIIMTYKYKSDDELCLLGIGIRLFNDIMSSFKLMISGYYQISLSIQRDLLETGFLLDYFRTDKSLITKWRTCSRMERLKMFSPKKVRDKLDERDRVKTRERERQYQLFCEYTSHPTHIGSELIAKEGLGEIGPFTDELKLKNTLFELTKQTHHAVAHFIAHFNFKSINLKKLMLAYIEKSNEWNSKYLGKKSGLRPRN
ncbi:MAG: hypothetical protein ACTSQ8_12725 [Candidatus Helarchaeota archaeon]